MPGSVGPVEAVGAGEAGEAVGTGEASGAAALAAGAARSAAIAAAGSELFACSTKIPGHYLGTVNHVFSHRRESYHVYMFRCPAGYRPAGRGDDPRGPDAGVAGVSSVRRPDPSEQLDPTHVMARWYRPDQLDSIAIPAAQQRIAAVAALHGAESA
jgi:hypothetical protein